VRFAYALHKFRNSISIIGFLDSIQGAYNTSLFPFFLDFFFFFFLGFNLLRIRSSLQLPEEKNQGINIYARPVSVFSNPFNNIGALARLGRVCQHIDVSFPMDGMGFRVAMVYFINYDRRDKMIMMTGSYKGLLCLLKGGGLLFFFFL
jgi:hypothetical protein